MTASNPPLLPDPPLFDVTRIAKKTVEGSIERFALEEIELRRKRSPRDLKRRNRATRRAARCEPDSSSRCIGYRPDRVGPVTVYEGQRRYLAAKRSHELAGTERYEGLKPVHSLIVLLLDHKPTADGDPAHPGDRQQRTRGAHASSTSKTSSPTAGWPAPDWTKRTGSQPCAPTSGSAPKKAHNLRRQLTLPERRSAPGSPSAPSPSSCRRRWPTSSRTCTRSPPS